LERLPEVKLSVFFDALMIMFQAVKLFHRQYFRCLIKYRLGNFALSIKNWACPEDCKYCPQSARYDTGLKKKRNGLGWK